MLKGKFAVLSLAAAALLCWQVAGVDTVNSGVIDRCNSTASSAAGTNFSCPQGDGDFLNLNGLTITATIRDNTNAPIPNIPFSDFWVKGCNDLLTLCNLGASSNADFNTNLSGTTTISGAIATGGCDTGLNVVCQSIVIGGGLCPDICLGIKVHTPDKVGGPGSTPDGIVNLSDLGWFSSTAYQSPPKPFTAEVECADYVPVYGEVKLGDFGKFSSHYTHNC